MNFEPINATVRLLRSTDMDVFDLHVLMRGLSQAERSQIEAEIMRRYRRVVPDPGQRAAKAHPDRQTALSERV